MSTKTLEVTLGWFTTVCRVMRAAYIRVDKHIHFCTHISREGC